MADESSTDTDEPPGTTHERIPPSAQLLGLPQEIFEYVAEDLDPAALKAIRLVCRDTAAKVLKIYTTVLFSNQAYFLNSTHSLETAVMMAKHPVFGPKMRKISLLNDEIERRGSEEDEEAQDEEELGDGEDEFDQSLPAKLSRRSRTRTMLTELFAQLKDIDELESVEIADFAACTAATTPGLEHLKAIADFGEPDLDDRSAFEDVIIAMSQAMIQVRSFNYVNSVRGGIPLAGLFSFRGFDRACLNAFRSLERVSLEMWGARSNYDYDTCDKLVELLASIPGLKDLKLVLCQCHDAYGSNVEDEISYSNDEYMSSPLLDQTMPKLECLSLEGIKVDLDHLTAFVSRHKALSQIHLVDIEFFGVPGTGERDMEQEVRDIIKLPGTYEDFTE